MTDIITRTLYMNIHKYRKLTFDSLCQRYFLVLEITQGAEPFIFLIESYQDAYRNCKSTWSVSDFQESQLRLNLKIEPQIEPQ